MLHIVVLLGPVLVPNEVSNKSFNYESVTTELFKEIALSLEHIFFFYMIMGFLMLDSSLMSLQGDGVLVWLAFNFMLGVFCVLLFLEQISQPFFPIFIDRNINKSRT